MKVTTRAAANIAFIKYWGARDLERAIPENPSISMTLRACAARTTVDFEADAEGPDEIVVRPAPDERGTDPTAEFRGPIEAQLERLRARGGRSGVFRVATQNTFPSATGLASSAAGFAALTLAATRALELELTDTELSSLARLSGSGSAARSVLGGYVEWPSDASDACAAQILAGADHWDLRDVIAVVDAERKSVSSREGHRRAPSSPFFAVRRDALPARLAAVRRALLERDLDVLGPRIEEEAIELHLVAMSSRPPIFYWKPGTLKVLEAVRALRRDGHPAYSTMDAGANVHVICPPETEAIVRTRLEDIPEVRTVILDGVGDGPSFDTEHLF